jgi:hypothetical protein
MAYTTPQQISFHPVTGHTNRADCGDGSHLPCHTLDQRLAPLQNIHSNRL